VACITKRLLFGRICLSSDRGHRRYLRLSHHSLCRYSGGLCIGLCLQLLLAQLFCRAMPQLRAILSS
jgi:hypothetical protein